MAKKIFVSYRHRDDQVAPIEDNVFVVDLTVRTYVDYLNENVLIDQIYKGEENDEDLSKHTEDTIKSHLADKIYDSSITIVLISEGMRNPGKKESEQWIPWEISYSLKEIPRGGKTSRSNAVLAVVLPNWINQYGYYLEDDACPDCHSRLLKTNFLFRILGENMFNIRKPEFVECDNHAPKTVYRGESSYILSVKWIDFINNPQEYLDKSVEIWKNISDYHLKKEVSDE